MRTVLITGANRGLGKEFARQYADDGWRVIATCRDPSAFGLDAEVHRLDVDDPDSLEALKESLADESIDLLINNAGIYGPRDSSLGQIDYDAWEQVLRTNVLGPIRVAEAFADNVAGSGLHRMVFLSSRMGSIAENVGGGEYIYRSSKVALNMAVRSLSLDLAHTDLIFLMFHPGWVRTDMGGPSAAIDAARSVGGMRKVIERSTANDSGKFLNYDGTEIAW